LGEKFKPFNATGEVIQNDDRAVQAHRATHTRVIQCRRLPMSMGHFGNEMLANQRAATQAGRVGLGPGLVNEDDLLWIKTCLLEPPGNTMLGDIGTVLFGSVDRLFCRNTSAASASGRSTRGSRVRPNAPAVPPAWHPAAGQPVAADDRG
jgi:hypothetical protein